MRKVLQKNKLTCEELQTHALYAIFMTIHPILLLHHRI